MLPGLVLSETKQLPPNCSTGSEGLKPDLLELFRLLQDIFGPKCSPENSEEYHPSFSAVAIRTFEHLKQFARCYL